MLLRIFCCAVELLLCCGFVVVPWSCSCAVELTLCCGVVVLLRSCCCAVELLFSCGFIARLWILLVGCGAGLWLWSLWLPPSRSNCLLRRHFARRWVMSTRKCFFGGFFSKESTLGVRVRVIKRRTTSNQLLSEKYN